MCTTGAGRGLARNLNPGQIANGGRAPAKPPHSPGPARAMDVREHDLPGVGKKFAVTTNDGDRLTIIIHNSGHREIYFFERGEDYPAYAVRMEDSEARKLGAILGGAFFQPVM